MYPHVDGAERRKDFELRAVFEQAYVRIELLLGSWGNGGRGVSTVLVFHMLQDSYPQLSAAQVHTLVAAALRLRRSRQARGQNKSVPAAGRHVPDGRCKDRVAA